MKKEKDYILTVTFRGRITQIIETVDSFREELSGLTHKEFSEYEKYDAQIQIIEHVHTETVGEECTGIGAELPFTRQSFQFMHGQREPVNAKHYGATGRKGIYAVTSNCPECPFKAFQNRSHNA